MALLKISIKVDGVLYKSERDDVPEEILNLHPAFKNFIIEDGKANSKKGKSKTKGTGNSESSEDS